MKVCFNALSLSFINFCFSFFLKKAEKNLFIGQNIVQYYVNLFYIKEEDFLSKLIMDFEKTNTNEICIYTINSITNLDNPVIYAKILQIN